MNQPTPVDGRRAIASKVSADEATIEFLADDERLEGERMAVGDSAVLAGFSFELVAIDKDDSKQPEGETGGDRTAVWILPR